MKKDNLQNIRHQTEIKANNLLKLFNLIKSNNMVSRSWLSKNSGLSPSTVSVLIDELILKGFIIENKNDNSNNQTALGRKPISLMVCPEKNLIIGMGIYTNTFTGCVYNLKMEKLYTLDSGEIGFKDNYIAVTIDFIKQLMSFFPGVNFRAIGISIPSIVSRKNQISQVAQNVLGLSVHGDDIRRSVENAFSIPVVVDNRGKLSGMAEKNTFYPDIDDFFYISMIKSGMYGYAAKFDGFSHTFFTCEIGHMSIQQDGRSCRCGGKGCIETYCSLENVTSSWEALLQKTNKQNGRVCTFDALIKAKNSGEKEAVDAVLSSAAYMGVGVSNIINLFNPQVVVIGGLSYQFGRDYLELVKAEAQARATPLFFEQCVITYSKFTEDTACLGAALSVLKQIERDLLCS